MSKILKNIAGPYLAVLINQQLTPEQTFGDMEKFYQEMALCCEEKGCIFYLIHIQPITSGEVTGYTHIQGIWQEQKFPLPNIVYNRVHSRRIEQSIQYQDFCAELAKRSIPIFNSRFLSKLEVHEILLKNDLLLSHLPETTPFNKENFHSFLNQFSSIYIKPNHGSQGRNIMKIHQEHEKWIIDFSENHLTRTETNESKAYSIVKKHSKRRSFLLQKTLPLMQWEQQTVDFRILLHLKPNGTWQVTSSTARLGEANKIISNVASGATMKNSKQFLKNIYQSSSEAKRIHHSLLQLARETAKTMEKESDGFFGELGIDLGLDEQLHPWIIEVNSKPSKKFEGNYTKLRPSVKAIIELMVARSCHADKLM